MFASARELSGYAQDALASADLIAWVAEDVSSIVGAVLTRRMTTDDGLTLGGVDELLVASTQRGSGIGRRLMTMAEQHYREARADGMQLTVREDNPEALGLYASIGYAVVQRRLRMRKAF